MKNRPFLTCVAIAAICAFVLAGIAFLPRLADAAVTANSIITAQTPNRGVVQFLQGTDTAGTYKTLYTGGANGSKCFGGWESNIDTSATHVITIVLTNATINYAGTSFTTASSDGTAGNVAKAWGTAWPGLPLDGNGNPFIYLVSGDTLRATFATALTSATSVSLGVNCVDF